MVHPKKKCIKFMDKHGKKAYSGSKAGVRKCKQLQMGLRDNRKSSQNICQRIGLIAGQRWNIGGYHNCGETTKDENVNQDKTGTNNIPMGSRVKALRRRNKVLLWCNYMLKWQQVESNTELYSTNVRKCQLLNKAVVTSCTYSHVVKILLTQLM